MLVSRRDCNMPGGPRFIMKSSLLPPMAYKVLLPTALKIPGKGVLKARAWTPRAYI